MNRAPISRRMSNRFAALATATSSTSGSSFAGVPSVPGTPNGLSGSVIGGFLLDEDDVESDDTGDDDPAEQPRRTPPQLVARVDVGLVVALGHAPDEPVELGDRFRRGEQRDPDHHRR